MRITAVKCILLSAPYAAPGDAEREVHHRTGFRTTSLVKVETDEGLYGLGETNGGIFAPETVRELVRQFEHDLIGQNPFDTLALWDRLHLTSYYWGRFGITQSVLGAIEMALWDLKGKALGQPVYQLLGGKMHQKIEVYASGGNPKPLKDLEAEMRGYVDAGYRTVKIRICEMPINQIVATVECCRRALGENVGLAADAVQGIAARPWSVKKAVEIACAIEPHRIRWIEEPTEVTDYAGMAEIRRQIKIPLAGGESITSLTEAEACLRAGAVDMLQIDASVVGGLSVFLQIAKMCERKFVPLGVHAWGSGIGILGNYHAAFATKNCAILELPSVAHSLREELMLQPLRICDGYLEAPATAGLGVSLPEDLEQKYPHRQGTYYRILRD